MNNWSVSSGLIFLFVGISAEQFLNVSLLAGRRLGFGPTIVHLPCKVLFFPFIGRDNDFAFFFLNFIFDELKLFYSRNVGRVYLAHIILIVVAGCAFLDHAHLGGVADRARTHTTVIEGMAWAQLLHPSLSDLLLIVVGLNELLIQVAIAPQTAAMYAGAHEFTMQAERLLEVLSRAVLGRPINLIQRLLILLRDGW